MALFWISWQHSTFMTHLYRRNACATKTKTMFLLRHFRGCSVKIFGHPIRQQGKGFYLAPNCLISFWMSLQELKSVTSVRGWSILVVRIAKVGPLREPIRMLLITIDQISDSLVPRPPRPSLRASSFRGLAGYPLPDWDDSVLLRKTRDYHVKSNSYLWTTAGFTTTVRM